MSIFFALFSSRILECQWQSGGIEIGELEASPHLLAGNDGYSDRIGAIIGVERNTT